MNTTKNKKTIIDKVINLLGLRGDMSLKEIYDSLPEHTQPSIRGNINRYLKNPDAKIRRMDKGVYSLIEVISIEDNGDGTKSVNFTASYYQGEKELHAFHKEYVTTDTVEIGTYSRMEEFESFEEMENNFKSICGYLAKGDAREILHKLKTESFDLILTDVPYRTISGGTGGKNAPTGMLSKNDGKIFENNDIEFDEYMPELYRILKPGSHAYIFTNFLNLEAIMAAIRKAGFKIHNLLAWVKNNATPNRWYMKNGEYVLLCYKGKAKAIKNCGSKTFHCFDNIHGQKLHETEKPTDLLKMYIENSTDEGAWVCDPFGGSGATLISSLLCNRKCLSIEIDKKYIDIAKERINRFLASGRDVRFSEN